MRGTSPSSSRLTTTYWSTILTTYDDSEVHKAVHRVQGHQVALKRFLMHNEKEGMPITALREIKILKALRNPNIIEILDMFVVRSEYMRLYTLLYQSNHVGRSRKRVAVVCLHGISLHGPRFSRTAGERAR